MKHVNFTQVPRMEQKVSRSLMNIEEQGLEHILKPISLFGLLITNSKGAFEYKLVCSSGHEYFIVADAKWRKILSGYVWEEVKLIGLLDTSDMTIIPQRIFPKGPADDKKRVVSRITLKGRDLLLKFASNVNELVLTPVAICAVMLS